MIEIPDATAEAAITALQYLAEEQERQAEQAQNAADAGMSNDLIYGYAPVAQAFRESARRYRDHMLVLINALEESCGG